MSQHRKDFLKQLTAGALVTGLPSMAFAKQNVALFDADDFAEEGAAADEKFWKKIAKK